MSTKKHEVPEELLSGLLADYKKPEDLIGENGLLKQLTKLLVERALDAELTEHLGHDRHESVANPTGNTRNGKSKKTLKGEFGELPIDIPRDRHGSFEPQLIPKHQTRWNGFDDKIITPYSPEQNGMVERVIRTLKEQCAHRHRFESLQHASRVIGDWIGFYNHQRPHQALGMKTPAEAYALAA